jgi:hypothetical protein
MFSFTEAGRFSAIQARTSLRNESSWPVSSMSLLMFIDPSAPGFLENVLVEAAPCSEFSKADCRS